MAADKSRHGGRLYLAELEIMLGRVGTAHHELPQLANLVGNAHPTRKNVCHVVVYSHDEVPYERRRWPRAFSLIVEET